MNIANNNEIHKNAPTYFMPSPLPHFSFQKTVEGLFVRFRKDKRLHS